MAYESFYEYLTALNKDKNTPTFTFKNGTTQDVGGYTPIADARAILVNRMKSTTLYGERNCVPNNAMNFHIAIKLILDKKSFNVYKNGAINASQKKQESTVSSALTRTLWQSGDTTRNIEQALFSKFCTPTANTLNDLVDNISNFASSIRISNEPNEIDLTEAVITNQRTKKKAKPPEDIFGEADAIITSYNNFLKFFTGKVIDITSSPQPTQTTLPTPSDLADLLQQKGQIILKGPPGTGKTRLAQLVAKEMDAEQIQLIQFHPSYSYEDFIMGLEVSTEGGNIKYEMKSRGIKAFADKAKDSKKPFVLIIDEINRAPVSSVFGELMYALEYRGEEITLSSGEKMTLPKNLYLIGTMNTADRSIAELDYAMQRRFDFVEIPPSMPELESGKLCAETLYECIKGIFKRENIMTGIDPKDVQLGTSYFICNSKDDTSNPPNKVLDKDHLKYKINYEIIPLLTEYYKDGVFRKKQVMFEGESHTFQDYFQGKQDLQKKLEGLK